MFILAVAAMQFSIPAGVAAERLNEFAVQSGLQVMFNSVAMTPVTLSAVEGEMEPFAALDRMLAGTDVQYTMEGNIVTLTMRESQSPYIFSSDGWFYSCIRADLHLGFIFTRHQMLTWRIGISEGLIPADQLYCVPDIPMTPDASPVPPTTTIQAP